MPTSLLTVVASFGSGKAGLTTVGYTLPGQPRSTIGVEDLGGGNYGVLVGFQTDGTVTLDTGETTPVTVTLPITAALALAAGKPDFPTVVATLLSRSPLLQATFPGGIRLNTWTSDPLFPLGVYTLSCDIEDGTADDLRADIKMACFGLTSPVATAIGLTLRNYMLAAHRRIQVAHWLDGVAWIEAGIKRVGSATLVMDYSAPDARTLWRHEQRFEIRFVRVT